MFLMRKFIFIFIPALLLFAFLFFLFFSSSREKNDADSFKEKSPKGEFSFGLNNIFITEEEIEMYEREISRDREEEGLSVEEIREAAIEKAIKEVVLDRYFKEKEITVSEEEKEEWLSSRIFTEDGVETEEEYFELMARRGISRAEVERKVVIDSKRSKAFNLIIRDIEVTEEEVFDYYLQRKEELEAEGASVASFEDVKGRAEAELRLILALEQLHKEIDEKRESLEIEILE